MNGCCFCGYSRQCRSKDLSKSRSRKLLKLFFLYLFRSKARHRCPKCSSGASGIYWQGSARYCYMLIDLYMKFTSSRPFLQYKKYKNTKNIYLFIDDIIYVDSFSKKLVKFFKKDIFVEIDLFLKICSIVAKVNI